MKISKFLATFGSLILLIFDSHAQADLQQRMQHDIAMLIDAAKKREMLWPWKGAEPEVKIVARYGKAAGPALVELLDPDPDFSEDADWQVQQQVALTRCEIYGVSDESGHVYSNRAPTNVNKTVRQFWLNKVEEK